MRCPTLLLLLFLASVSITVADTFAERVVLSTYKLFNEKSTAAGFLIEGAGGACFVVSAAHVFEKMEGERAVLVLRKKQVDGTYARYDQEIAVRDGKTALWVKHPQQDVAVLKLVLEAAGELPAEVEVVALPENALASAEAAQESGLGVGTDVWVCGYPTRFEVNRAGFAVTRRAGVASFPLRPVGEYPTMILDFTTFEGDSGGAVFLRKQQADEPLVVGLVISQYWHTEKLQTFSGKQTINHSLGLATAVQSTAILETLELAREEEKPEPESESEQQPEPEQD